MCFCIPVLAQAQEHFNPKGSGATGHTSSLQADSEKLCHLPMSGI